MNGEFGEAHLRAFADTYRDVCSRCWASSSKNAPTKDAVNMSFACTPLSALTLHTPSTLAGEMFMLRLASSLTALAALLTASLSAADVGAFASACSGAGVVLAAAAELSWARASHTIPLQPRIMVSPVGTTYLQQA